MDFEIPLLEVLIKLGGGAKTKDIYPEVEKIMGLSPSKSPEEYEAYRKGQIKWKNKTAWAREYDWIDSPVEVLCLKEIIAKIKNN